MKILYLTDQTYLHGGIEQVLSLKANWLADVAGDEVHILTTEQEGRMAIYPFSKKVHLHDLGIAYERSKSYFHPTNLRLLPLHYRKLKHALQKFNPDVVVSCHYGPDFHFLPFIEPKIPKVKEYHSSRFPQFQKTPGFRHRLMRNLNSATEQRYHAIAILNPDERPYYHAKRIAVIPNPAATHGYVANTVSKKVMAAGRISPVKNFGALIRVWSRLAKRHPDWELHIYGQDYVGTQAQLEKQVEDLKLEASVKFMGAVDSLPKAMQDYSIYALSSETECFSMVLLESLAAGLPVVGFDCPTGPRHIVSRGIDGFLVEQGDELVFAMKLEELMSDQSLRKRMGEHGKRNAERFEINKVMEQWHDLFLSLIYG